MIGLAVALSAALAGGAPGTGVVGARIRDSAAAAQALQGPLDGGWIVYDSRRRPLLALEISDPAGGAGPIEGAWRRVAGSAASGPIDSAAPRGDRLWIDLAMADGVGRARLRLRLRRRGPARWSGSLTQDGRARWVTLSRAP